MSGTFALSAKFALSQFDMEVQSALLSDEQKEFERHSSLARRALRTLREDLEVYQERSLEKADTSLILSNIEKIKLKSDELLAGWRPVKSSALLKDWREDKALKQTYRALTSNYDTAAETGYKFRLDSEEKINANTRLSMIALAVSAVGSLALSIWLSLLIISPLNRIKATCQDVSDGNFNVRAESENPDEFGMLAASFNIMLDNIEDKRENMSSLLTTIPFALFYFDREGKISEERSRATDKIFPAFSTLPDLYNFFHHYGETSEQVREVVDVMFANALPFKSAAFLLPQTLKVTEGETIRTIQLSYQAKRNAQKKLERVIILGEDVTEKEKAQARNLYLMERVERISKISGDLNGYKEFHSEASQLMSASSASINQPSAGLMRDLHSIKGLLGIYSFHEIARKVHSLESELEKTRDESSTAVHRSMTEIQDLFKEQTDDISKILALDIGKNYRFYDQRKMENIRKISELTGNATLISAIESLERYPLKQIFSKYILHVQELSQKFDDKKVRLDFISGDELAYSDIKPLDQILIHIFNNSIDHGIETSTERITAGKSETGLIELSCKVEGKKLSLIISDDGRGIDSEKLIIKARNSGMAAPGNPLDLIFEPGLSIKEEASVVSGRGIGMDAVKSHIESQGGSIKVSSVPGSGTKFTIQIPLENHAPHTS